MNEPIKRRSLLGALEAPAPTVPETSITETAARNGFSTSNATAKDLIETRRKRQPTGRVHQFNVRLRSETLEAIYSQANDRNVPVAQVIEEAMAALLR